VERLLGEGVGCMFEYPAGCCLPPPLGLVSVPAPHAVLLLCVCACSSGQWVPACGADSARGVVCVIHGYAEVGTSSCSDLCSFAVSCFTAAPQPLHNVCNWLALPCYAPLPLPLPAPTSTLVVTTTLWPCCWRPTTSSWAWTTVATARARASARTSVSPTPLCVRTCAHAREVFGPCAHGLRACVCVCTSCGFCAENFDHFVEDVIQWVTKEALHESDAALPKFLLVRHRVRESPLPLPLCVVWTWSAFYHWAPCRPSSEQWGVVCDARR
jgi:hypothetical protein